ncbi:hypothetical protein GWK47_004624 [Chionoecetes opilio]|uniref:CCHC-type domain-containing protein n=1 Tax=Chionoecetes opilio TaxID=41210 RepID=A0A8J4YMX7_CHIOP|nr:hypothetical protein GWK47_004624 [Chionoecetes opilio]
MEKQRPFNPDNDTIDNWLERFELRCELQEIPAERRAKWCKITIGDVGNDLTTAITAATWEEWKTALKKELGHPDEENASRRDLATLTQGDLSLRALARQARQLANRAFNGAGQPIIEQEAIEAFLKALPLNLKREVLRTRTTTLEAAWEEAERHHQLMKTLPPTPVIVAATEPPAPSRLDQLESTIAALQHHLLNDNTGERRRTPKQRRSKDELRCWSCGNIGHLQRECRKTRNSTNKFRPLNSNGGRP